MGKYSKGTPEQLLELVRDRIDQLTGSVESATNTSNISGEPIYGEDPAWEEEDWDQEVGSWEMMAVKSVQDSDGFWTDYTMYHNLDDDTFVFVFGDRDVYNPDNSSWDWECDNEDEAWEWFEDYQEDWGSDEFGDYEEWGESPVDECQDIQSSEDFFDKGDGQEYWYFTKHGVQPGSVPRGLEILDVVDKPEGSYFLTNRVLTTDALKYYDIREKAPQDIESSSEIYAYKDMNMKGRAAHTKAEANRWKADEIYTIFDLRGKKEPDADYYESKEDAIRIMNTGFPARSKVMSIDRDGYRKLVQYHDGCYD